ncbi:MarR family transcriptional regulator [Micromonospora sp. NPDC049051]|uniref:MarR family transcriptional regulator n=1 Tax=Micromonospora sp. NPDC049051 TaxID=3364264 RepID=UPI0037218642
MTDPHEGAAPVHSAFKVLAALAELGETTAAAIAEHAGLGYSTTTPKLRAWEGSGQAERFRTDDGRTLWRLTDSGRAATATPHPTTAPEKLQAPADPGTNKQNPANDGPSPTAAADDPQQPNDSASPLPHPDQQPQAAPEPTKPNERSEEKAEAPAVATSTPIAPTDQDVPGKPTSAHGQPDAETTDVPAQDSHPGTARRTGGSLRGAVLDILEAHPDRAYKTSELCKLIDAANAGTGAAKASPGAVANAATKLAAAGTAVQTVERPATFQLAPATVGQ